jgi:phospholipid/cholesterol/gamma-HCH transport system substrate-binding protein
MVDYVKNMLIGLFVAIAVALLAAVILFLEPSVGDGKETIVIRFANINGITVGTRVMFAGKPVGEVVAIEQIPHAREQPTDEMGQIYFYQLILHVDSSVRAYNTDEFSVQTSGLLGEKSIAITPKSPPKGVKPKLITAETPVYAESVDPLESAFNELGEISDKVEEALDKVITWIDQNGHELGAAIKSFDETMAEASITLERINRTGLIDTVSQVTRQVGTAAEDVHIAMEELFDGDAFAEIARAAANIRAASGALTEENGTIGRLLNDDQTYLQITALLGKVDTLMNDINHYGILFNLNKEWKRSRQRQASFLTALDTPEAFRDYFNREVDLINTAMARLSMLIERAESQEDGACILESPAFKRDFADMMRSINELYDAAKLYNEQLQEASP